ncbi:hypothetical protein A2774_04890 [Candidatus Roizmanbacteria bacterium RIFCSPHIGHO2_01_FULL_39_12c]|uniref:HIT domain-containing protein n=1 Tax=Candidatus Roizmanbacteria bacterium RIFCSPHIGHO2_01_FULL_39_12c TaxID=1802031 RepID=A0A1F7GE36_9BACT|nr:MAG: hypothetical protein A2774_04890 [Candidatus Roizmanbacteria bacterium RIFCSPHIGHO2_01_FULL_39_12c]OGK46894.1 MAG: hypothetical protein A2963_05040 [Candidatus Roizmanbacteria bacterium RIFCSPLOWO2_01_FULL_40_13]
MDIFCQIKEKLNGQIIDETENFYLLHDGYPLFEGHLLIIPKFHIRCFLELNKKNYTEFSKLKLKVINFLKNNYRQPVLFEHGIAGQTVLHAHLHLLPTDILITDELNKIGSIIKTPFMPYVYFEYGNKRIFIKPKIKIKPGLIHSYLYARKLNRSQIGIERAKELSKWLISAKRKYLLWKNL